MKNRTVFRDKASSRRTLFLLTIVLLALAPLASGQLVYSEVRVKVEPGVTCPSGWTSQSESVTTPTRYIVQVPVSIGGRAFLVTTAFVDLIWPTAANKAAAVASGLLTVEAGSTVEAHYCDLLP